MSALIPLARRPPVVRFLEGSARADGQCPLYGVVTVEADTVGSLNNPGQIGCFHSTTPWQSAMDRRLASNCRETIHVRGAEELSVDRWIHV